MAGNYYLDKYGAPQGAVPIGPPNQKYPYEVQQAATNVRKTNADMANDAERLRISRQQLALQQQQAEREARNDAEERAKETLSPEQLAAVRAEAQMKLQKLDSLIERSKNNYFATGMGTNGVSVLGIPLIPGKDNPGSNAYDQQRDVDTVASAGALTKVMEMAAANGGKNPLTPLSEGDFANIAKSITNLDIGQSDEQFQKNANEYRDIYRRALRGAGGFDAGALRPEDADKALEGGYRNLIQQMQGKPPRVRQDMLRRFEADDRIQTLRRMAPSLNGAPRKQASNSNIVSVEKVSD